MERSYAVRSNTDTDEQEFNEAVMHQLCSFVNSILDERATSLASRIAKHQIPAICVMQPHRSKKDILFTALTFAIVIARQMNVESIFSTDSDSIMGQGSLESMVSMMNTDTNIGGVSAHLRFFHPRPTLISRMMTSFYWFDQEVSKAQGSFFGITECQPGPGAAFKVGALREVLVSWYHQRLWGQKMVRTQNPFRPD